MNQTVGTVNEVEVKESLKSKFIQRVWAKMGKDEKGFTLIELLAVLVIIAIIAVIAIPLIGNIINNSRNSADVATARQVYDASRLYITGESDGVFAGTTAVTVTVEQMQEEGYLDKPLAMPSTKDEITAGTVTYTTDGSLASVSLTSDGKAESFTAEQVLSQTK